MKSLDCPLDTILYSMSYMKSIMGQVTFIFCSFFVSCYAWFFACAWAYWVPCFSDFGKENYSL